MNCIEALSQKMKECKSCQLHSFIIESEELPDSERNKFEAYNKKTDFILYCQKCSIYTLLPTIHNKEA